MRTQSPYRIAFAMIVGCLGFLSSHGQTVYTNVLNHVAHDSRPAFEVVGDYYYVANTLNIWPYSQMQYVKIDTNGTVLDTLEIVWDHTEVFPAGCPKCLDYHNGVLYHAYSDFVASDGVSDSAVAIFTKLSLDLSDTIVTKYYQPINSRSSDIKELVFDTDSTFIIGAVDAYYLPDSTFKYRTLIARLDTNFNVLWETLILDTDMSRNFGVSPEDIVVDAYGTILVTGSPAWGAMVNEAFAARLNRFTGQLLWRKTYTGTIGTRGMNAADHGDGTYRYVQSWITDEPKAHHLYHIGILDTSGNIISERVYGKDNRTQTANDLVRLSDGNYYCAGVTHQFTGLGFKFTPSLDSLWMLNYRYGASSNTCYLEMFQEDSSGMIVHNGWVTHNQLDNWLFRVDKNGCQVSNCRLNIEEHENEQSPWRIFPNPSDGWVTLDHPNIAHFGVLHIEVYDALGQLVLKRNHSQGTPISFRLETSGLYVIQILPEHTNAERYQTTLIVH